MSDKLLRPVGPLQLDLVAWFARGGRMLELQPARLGQRPELLNTQGPIRLRHVCKIAPSYDAAFRRR